MMPILIVDGDPADWLLPYGDPCPCEREHRNAVRIDGDLPIVSHKVKPGEPRIWQDHPRRLRVGDKVTLAYMDQEMIAVDCRVPFATATVAKVQPVSRIVARRQVTDRWLVTVSDVEALR
jgi:hypothetical protein